MKIYSKRLLLIGFCLFWSSTACAAISLSALPLGGGSSVRFGRVEGKAVSNKEVKLRVNASGGEQYRIYQRILEPLANQKGQTLNPRVIKTGGIAGSNSSGTLYAQNQEVMAYADQLVYTSSVAGNSDSLTMVYSLSSSDVDLSGNFFGKIAYTLRPFDGGAQQTVILNVTAERNEEFDLQVKGFSRPDILELKSGDILKHEDGVTISFSGLLGSEIKVYQEVDQLPRDQEFNEIKRGAIQFQVFSNETSAVRVNELKDLKAERILLYRGDVEADEIQVQVLLNKNKLSELKAGDNLGRVRYDVETDNGVQVFPFDLKVGVAPVLNMAVELPAGGIQFKQLLPDSPPQVAEAFVTIDSNIGRPYMISQVVTTPLMNEAGYAIEEKNFQMKIEILQGGNGKTSGQDYRSVQTEEQSMYFSDAKGSPVKLRVLYRLRSYPTIEPGNYSTSIRYSLGEI